MTLVRTYLPTYLLTYLPNYLTVEQKIGWVPSFLFSFLNARITSFLAVGLIFSLFMLQLETNADFAFGKRLKFFRLASKPNQQNSSF